MLRCETIAWPKTMSVIPAMLFFIAGVLSSPAILPVSSPPPSVPAILLQHTAPVALDIEYHPTITPRSGLTELSGKAVFIFRNQTDQPIQIAFPPTRVFRITAESVSREADVPVFARTKRIVDIPANGSVSFEDNVGMILVGKISKFLHGGVGWMGFVFEHPREQPEQQNFCVGTVFSQYSVPFRDEGG